MGGLVFTGVADGAVALGAEEDGAGPEGARDRVEGLGQAASLPAAASSSKRERVWSAAWTIRVNTTPAFL